MSSRVSVVIPTYNAIRFIDHAVESVMAQTATPFEIIIVDDGSTDGTPTLVEQISARSAVPVKLMRMPANTGGPAGPLNTGIDAASCELVAILEQDDLMAPSRLEQQSAAAVRHPECAMVIGRVAVVTEMDGQLRWDEGVPAPADIPHYAGRLEGESFVVPSDVAFRSLMRSNFIYSNSNVLLRRTPFKALGGFDPRWPINSDADFEFRLLMSSPIAVVNSITCGYRYRGDSLYHSRSRRARADGLLIRLKWGSKRWDWAPQEAQAVYWAVRADLAASIRARNFAEAWRAGCGLALSGAFSRHLLSRVWLATFHASGDRP